MDGLVAAVLVTSMEDITDNKFKVREDDVLANLPYHPNCAM